MVICSSDCVRSADMHGKGEESTTKRQQLGTKKKQKRTEQDRTGHTWKMVSSLTAFLSLDARV